MSQKFSAPAHGQADSARHSVRTGWLRQIVGGRGDRDFAPTRADGFADTEAHGFPDTEPLPLAELPHHRHVAPALERA
jgi:hypothetical protein